MGQLFGAWVRRLAAMLRGRTVCRASLIMWLTDFIYVQDELF
jgi:hypothetical protein